jgi:hypothetical protein
MAMISIAQPATWFSSYRIQVQGHPGAVLGTERVNDFDTAGFGI